MTIDIRMPALSPTMEEGTLARWLVQVGDKVRSGDLIAEIETDKATMEFEAVDEGEVLSLLIAAGTEGVKVGTIIARISGESEDSTLCGSPSGNATALSSDRSLHAAGPSIDGPAARRRGADTTPRIKASPLARRIAAAKRIELAGIEGTGPDGRIRKADIEALLRLRPADIAELAAVAGVTELTTETSAPASPVSPLNSAQGGPPHSILKLSAMRKVIAKRLTESKQQVPHIYLTVDVRLDALLDLRAQLNEGLAIRGVKLSVNDLLIKAQAMALMAVPSCNVMFGGETLTQYERADISVAVSIPGGLITPIITAAERKSVSAIAIEMKALAERAREGTLQPHEFQGGTASMSNMGMLGIKQFAAIINPPQAMILGIGAGEQRPVIVDGAVLAATVMSVTGSFDHRAVDGSDGAQFMATFKTLVESPMAMLA